MRFRAGPFVLCKNRCWRRRRRNTDFGPNKFFPPKMPPPQMCSQNDQRDVGIILSHICPPPPPAPLWHDRTPALNPPLPAWQTRRGDWGVVLLASHTRAFTGNSEVGYTQPSAFCAWERIGQRSSCCPPLCSERDGGGDCGQARPRFVVIHRQRDQLYGCRCSCRGTVGISQGASGLSPPPRLRRLEGGWSVELCVSSPPPPSLLPPCPWVWEARMGFPRSLSNAFTGTSHTCFGACVGVCGRLFHALTVP